MLWKHKLWLKLLRDECVTYLNIYSLLDQGMRAQSEALYNKVSGDRWHVDIKEIINSS